MLRKTTALLFLSFILFIANAFAQSDETTEPTTVSNVTDAVLPWNAKRVLPDKVPAEFNQLFEKLLAEGKGKLVSGPREVLVWEGNYRNKSKASAIVNELKKNFTKESWAFETAANEGDVELFTLVKEESNRVVLGFFVPTDEVFVCAFMEIRKADEPVAQVKAGNKADASIVGKWFRTTGGSSIDWTGKTTLKGGEDFTFEFSADGSVEYTRKKEVLNVMQCRIKSEQNARGHYKLSGDSLTIDLGAMRSVNSNTCDTKDNYDKTLGNSSMTVRIKIEQTDSITRPDKPYTMCFDGNEVCYEKQR